MAGLLRVVGTPIGNLGDLSPRAAAALAEAQVIACEDTRRTRKLLSSQGIPSGNLVALHAHNEWEQSAALVQRLIAGDRVTLVSDAGMPAISDPGQHLVAEAAAAGIRIEVVPGPSAVLAALTVSGLTTDRFCFEGFLPRKGRERRSRLHDVGAESRTCVLFEAPHRVRETLADLATACGLGRRVAVARELTKIHEEVWRGSLGEAVAHWATVEPRGEFVLVVEGAAPLDPAGDDAVEAAMRTRLAAGEDRRQAVAGVVADLGVAKRRAYAIGVRLAAEEAPHSR